MKKSFVLKLRKAVAFCFAAMALLQPLASFAQGAREALKLKPEQEKMAVLLADYYVQKGWSEDVVVGIVSNLFFESSLNPAGLNTNGASGLAQWLGVRKKLFIKKYGVPPHKASWRKQADFIQLALTDKTSPYKFIGEELRKAKTPEQAVLYFARDYEVPGRNRKEATKVAKKRAEQALLWKKALKEMRHAPTLK